MTFKLKRADYPGTYHGFTLKEGFWYGVEIETGNFAATSGWERGNAVSMYVCENGKWQLTWWDISETDFILENIPAMPAGKMDFKEWIHEKYDMSYQEYLESDYSESDFVDENYEDYLYDWIPLFVRKYMHG